MYYKKLHTNVIIFLILVILNNPIVHSASNQPTQLNQFEVFSFSPNGFIITDDNTVLFNQVTDAFTFDVDLFATDISGQSDPVFLANNNFQNFGFDFVYDPDNQHVLNLALDDDSTITRSTTINGSSSTTLSSGVNTSGINTQVFLSISSETLDGTDFYYFVENNILYTIPVDGSSPAIRISPELPETSRINFVTISNNREQIIFSVLDADSDSEFIYIAETDGNSTALLLTELPENVFVDFILDNTFSFILNDSRVIFNTESFDDDTGENTHQIYRLSLNSPSDATPISTPIKGFSLNSNLLVFNDTIIYSVENRDRDLSQLFSVNMNGSRPPVLLDSGISIPEFKVLHDTATPYVVYSKEVSLDTIEVFSTLVDGSLNPRPLRAKNIDFTSNQNIDSFNILVSQKQGLVFYVSNQLSDDNFNIEFGLFSAPIDGSSSATLISPDIGANFIRNIQLGANEKSIFYIFDTQDFMSEIFQSNINNSNIQKISQGNVRQYQLSNDGNYIVYSSSSVDGFSSQTNLFSVKLEDQEQPLCFPIRAKNDNFVTICL